MLHVHRKVPVHTLQLGLSFLNFKMFHFKIKSTKMQPCLTKKPWKCCLYIKKNLAFSARNHGCTSIYKLRSFDVQLNNNTQNQIEWNRMAPVQRQCCKVQNGYMTELSRTGEWTWLINSPREKSHSPRVTGECNSRALQIVRVLPVGDHSSSTN